MHELDKIVKQMIEEHEGGTVFFDNLDKAVQKKPILYALLDLVHTTIDPKRDYGITVSGKFGRYLVNHVDYHSQPFIIVNGGLRDVIKNELEKYGARLAKTFVIYDGSREKDDTVHSLYRYYDNY